MKPHEDPAGTLNPAPDPDGNKEPTGLPGLHTWRAVYIFVLACFALSVGLLVALTVIYR